MHPSDNDFPQSSEHGYAPSAGPAIHFSDIRAVLRREWLLPLLGVLMGLALALSYIVMVPSLYKSSARILIDKSVNRYLQSNKIVDEPVFDEMETGSQIYILSSESVIVPVVRAMKLADDPEFVGPPTKGEGGDAWSFASIQKAVMKVFGRSEGKEGDTAATRERLAVETFLKRLTVQREDVANVINVSFSSENSVKAADISNAVADAYLSNALEAKLNSTKLASKMMQDRLIEVKEQALNADRALQNFKLANNLVSTGRASLTTEQLSNLNTQLTNARIALVEAKTRIDGFQSGGGDKRADRRRLSGDMVDRLRLEYRDVSAKASDIESRVGPQHIAAVKLRKKMDELSKAIREEEQSIAGSVANEYQVAQARNKELTTAMAELVGEVGSTNQAQVTMRELESSAETLRTLYNGYLQKFKEMNAIQSQGAPVQDARVITRAAPPLYKSSKKSMAVLAGSLSLGLFLGLGAALAKEWAASVFRTPNQVRAATDIDCVVLPAVKVGGGRKRASRDGQKSGLLEEYVLDAPFSRFTETLRNVRASIDIAHRLDGAKVFCVVSSVAKEGKTTIAANLANLMISSSSGRTLLIDGDLHRRLLTAKLAPDAKEGLMEALADPSRLSALVTKRERSGLDVLPCVHEGRVRNAAEVLGSPQMEQLLAAARESYDYIIVEIAPIMSVVDVKMIERYVDKFIFVIEWGQTKKRLVAEALSEADIIRDRVLAVVLNKADPDALKVLESYKGARFKDYYEG